MSVTVERQLLTNWPFDIIWEIINKQKTRKKRKKNWTKRISFIVFGCYSQIFILFGHFSRNFTTFWICKNSWRFRLLNTLFMNTPYIRHSVIACVSPRTTQTRLRLFWVNIDSLFEFARELSRLYTSSSYFALSSPQLSATSYQIYDVHYTGKETRRTTYASSRETHVNESDTKLKEARDLKRIVNISPLFFLSKYFSFSVH